MADALKDGSEGVLRIQLLIVLRARNYDKGCYGTERVSMAYQTIAQYLLNENF